MALGILDHFIRIGYAKHALRTQALRDTVEVQLLVRQEGVRRHDAFRHQSPWVLEVVDLPFRRILAADTGQVWSRALGTPLERMVVHAFRRQRVVAVTFDLVAQGPHHLTVADIAALTDIDIPAHKFERGVGTHAVNLLDGVVHIGEGRHLDQATNRYNDKDADGEQKRVPLQQSMFVHDAHGVAPIQPEPASCVVRELRMGRAWPRPARQRHGQVRYAQGCRP
mmetsp:Transcript_23075/g.58278  ORF Transcript_23075/g.58278 Transcript_23075/m.58278 type:complete len:224 (-) Transcript_23075:1599-2270(-)